MVGTQRKKNDCRKAILRAASLRAYLFSLETELLPFWATPSITCESVRMRCWRPSLFGL